MGNGAQNLEVRQKATIQARPYFLGTAFGKFWPTGDPMAAAVMSSFHLADGMLMMVQIALVYPLITTIRSLQPHELGMIFLAL